MATLAKRLAAAQSSQSFAPGAHWNLGGRSCALASSRRKILPWHATASLSVQALWDVAGPKPDFIGLQRATLAETASSQPQAIVPMKPAFILGSLKLSDFSPLDSTHFPGWRPRKTNFYN